MLNSFGNLTGMEGEVGEYNFQTNLVNLVGRRLDELLLMRECISKIPTHIAFIVLGKYPLHYIV